MAKFVVTIARGFGSGGKTIGKMLSERLGVHYYDREILALASEESGIHVDLYERADEKAKGRLFRRYSGNHGKTVISPDSDEFVSDDNLFNYQAKIIRSLAEKENCIIIGRCADYILRNKPGVVRLFIYADRESCINKVMELYGGRHSDANDRIEKIDRTRAAYYKYYTSRDWYDLGNYDLCINTAVFSFEETVEVIVDYLKRRGALEEDA